MDNVQINGQQQDMQQTHLDNIDILYLFKVGEHALFIRAICIFIICNFV